MASARFWVACGAAGAMLAACGSDDTTRTARGEGGEGGEEAAAGGAAPTPEAGSGGSAPIGGQSPVVEAGAGGTPVVVDGGGGAGPDPEPVVVVVEPKYPESGPYWLDYVKNDGADRLNASDTACEAATDGPLYGACVHGGEIRRVALPDEASCAGLSATDALAAFDWVCQPGATGVELVSSGLAQGKHMSDLLDFEQNAWLLNSVTITRDDTTLAASEPAAWWENPIKRLPGTSCVADVGAAHDIFLLDATSSNANCTGAVGQIGLATVPGETVTDFRFNGRGAYNWYEGAYTLQAQFAALTPGNNGFHVVRNASFTALATGGGFAAAISMGGARASVVRDITATGGRIIVGAGSAVGLQVSDLTSTGAGTDVVSFNTCSDCSVVRADISNAGNRAIYVQGVNPRLLVQDVVTSDTLGGGVALSQVIDGRVENVKVTRAGAGGVTAILTARTVFKSIVVDHAVGVGVSVDQGDDNRLVDIHVGDAGANGVFIGGNRTVLQHARVSCGKGLSVTVGSGVAIPANTFYGRMQDVTTTSCRYGIRFDGSANLVQAVTVAASEEYGINNASYGSLVEDAVAIDNSYGLYYLSNVFGPTRLRNFASTHNADGSVYANNSTLDIAEHLIVGSNNSAIDCDTTGTTGLDDTCGGHTGVLSSGQSVLNSIVGLVSDATNPQGASGSSGYDAITSFTTFATETRRFIRAGTGFPDYAARGPCTGTATCSILDLALQADDALLRNRNALPTGNDVTTHAWFTSGGPPADQAACTARVPGSVFVAGTPNRCDSVFLKHAWELLEDGVGDNDGLCESDETCEVARNIGGYQGHGAFVSAGAFTPGTLTGITLVQRETNGY